MIQNLYLGRSWGARIRTINLTHQLTSLHRSSDLRQLLLTLHRDWSSSHVLAALQVTEAGHLNVGVMAEIVASTIGRETVSLLLVKPLDLEHLSTYLYRILFISILDIL